MRIGIIGAGMAGLSCAGALRDLGHQPVVFDKGRGPGGRMATRRIATPLGEAGFDHGAQYLTARDPAFVAQVEHWAQAGHVARWPTAGADAWVGTPAMNAPIRAMAAELDVRWNARVDALSRDSLSRDSMWQFTGDASDIGDFDVAIVATPAEQVAPLLAGHDAAIADEARSTVSDPCWTVMLAFRDRIPVVADRLVDVGMIGSAVRNSAKPQRSGLEAWVLQANADWSRDHLEHEPATIQRALTAAFATIVQADLPPVIATSVHRWRYAKSGTSRRGQYWNADVRLGVCGDWLIGARVEAAWLSGQRLAARIGPA